MGASVSIMRVLNVGGAVGHGGEGGSPSMFIGGEGLGLWVEIEHWVQCQFRDTNSGSDVKGFSDKMNT